MRVSDVTPETVRTIDTMKTRKLAVIVYQEEGVYIAECPEIGTVDQGKTIESAIEALKAATQL